MKRFGVVYLVAGWMGCLWVFVFFVDWRTDLDVVFEGVQVEGSVEETLQLQKMGVLVSSSRGGGRLTPGIPTHGNTEWAICENIENLVSHDSVWEDESLPDRLGTVDGGAHAGLDIVVVSLVLMLLLTPDQVSIGIFLGLCPYQVKRERRELGRENQTIIQKWKQASIADVLLKRVVPAQCEWWPQSPPCCVFCVHAWPHNRFFLYRRLCASPLRGFELPVHHLGSRAGNECLKRYTQIMLFTSVVLCTFSCCYVIFAVYDTVNKWHLFEKI